MSIKKARKTLQNKEKFNYDILDKVANSGSTIEACSRVLKDAGIERVYFAVLCATGGR